MGVAGEFHGAVVGGQGARIIEVACRDRAGVLVELGGAILPALLQAHQQTMGDGAGLQLAFCLGVAGEAAGLEILLPAGAGHLSP
jgi:hypothetical protein